MGCHLYIWKESEGIQTAHNITYTPDDGFAQFDDVAKWTIYCAQVAGFTAVGVGPRSAVECTRTFEDGNILTLVVLSLSLQFITVLKQPEKNCRLTLVNMQHQAVNLT